METNGCGIIELEAASEGDAEGDVSISAMVPPPQGRHVGRHPGRKGVSKTRGYVDISN